MAWGVTPRRHNNFPLLGSTVRRCKWSLCAGGPAEEDDAPPVGAQGQHHGQGEDEGGPDQGGDFGNSAYRPARALARELIDEAAMEPEHQVELPRGVARSAFNVHNAKMPQAPGGGPVNAGAPGAPLSSFTSATFGRRGLGAQDTAESAAQAEVLGEELKKEGNALYNEGQLEAAELVYTEALKVRPLRARTAGRTRVGTNAGWPKSWDECKEVHSKTGRGLDSTLGRVGGLLARGLTQRRARVAVFAEEPRDLQQPVHVLRSPGQIHGARHNLQ